MTDENSLVDWISTAEAAEILQVTPRQVRNLIRAKEIKARRIGERVYLVSKPSVYEYDAKRNR